MQGLDRESTEYNLHTHSSTGLHTTRIPPQMRAGLHHHKGYEYSHLQHHPRDLSKEKLP